MSLGDIIISGFGSPNVNGIYSFTGTFNGRNFYHLDGTNYYLMYFASWMPWSDHLGYYIVEIKVLPNTLAIPIYVPKYMKPSNDPLDSTPWISFMSMNSGESTTGSITDEMSSSSSSSTDI